MPAFSEAFTNADLYEAFAWLAGFRLPVATQPEKKSEPIVGEQFPANELYYTSLATATPTSVSKDLAGNYAAPKTADPDINVESKSDEAFVAIAEESLVSSEF